MNRTWSSWRHIATTAFGAVVAFAGGVASAQDVAIRLVEADSGRPVTGAVVSMVSFAPPARPVRQLTSETGSALFRGLERGWYRVRVERIGHHPVVADTIEVTRGSISRIIRVAPTPMSLPEITVTDRNACGQAALDADRLVALWTEIRTGLLASQLITRDRTRRFRVLLRRRTLDPDRRIRRVRTDTAIVAGFRPFQAASSQQLERVGYILRDQIQWQVLGPDEEQLLSPHFAATHCFGIDRRRNDLGLTFRPVPSRTEPDIEGVMWIDRMSRLLTAVEFSYVNVPNGLRTEGLEGKAEFGDLPTGGRYVRRWFIRIPWVETRKLVGGTGAHHIDVIGGYHEDGGEAWPAPAETRVVALSAMADSADGDSPTPAPSDGPAAPVRVDSVPTRPAASTGPRRGRDRNLILAEEMRGRGLVTAYDAIRALRPAWLRPTRPSGRVGRSFVEEVSDTASGLPTVYSGSAQLATPEDLRQIQVEDVIEIRYVPPFEATRARSSDTFGAIVVTVR